MNKERLQKLAGIEILKEMNDIDDPHTLPGEVEPGSSLDFEQQAYRILSNAFGDANKFLKYEGKMDGRQAAAVLGDLAQRFAQQYQGRGM